jgi:hypothetical protein
MHALVIYSAWAGWRLSTEVDEAGKAQVHALTTSSCINSSETEDCRSHASQMILIGSLAYYVTPTIASHNSLSRKTVADREAN